MLNSVSFNPSFSGIKVPPTGRGGVKIGGRVHPVIKVPVMLFLLTEKCIRLRKHVPTEVMKLPGL